MNKPSAIFWYPAILILALAAFSACRQGGAYGLSDISSWENGGQVSHNPIAAGASSKLEAPHLYQEENAPSAQGSSPSAQGSSPSAESSQGAEPASVSEQAAASAYQPPPVTLPSSLSEPEHSQFQDPPENPSSAAPPLPGEAANYSSAANLPDKAIDSAEFEKELFGLINEERTRQGIEPFGLEENMRWAARIRAPEVLQSLSHTRPDGTVYYTAFDEAGFAYAGKWHGENVGYMHFTAGDYDCKTAAALMFEELKNSSGHLRNMLNQNFSQIGIGVFVSNDGTGVHIASAQLFASF